MTMTTDVLGRPIFDARDQQLLDARITNRNALPGPRVGDFVIMRDGAIHRFSHDWQEGGLQTSEASYNPERPWAGGSWYLGSSGLSSFSGGLDPIIKREHLAEVGYERNGSFWFFHHDIPRAHCGVTVSVPCRVFVNYGRP